MPDQRICDYEGSTYRTDFWEGRGRNYEDLVERSVLARLLPDSGKRLLEIGAGFGRITNEYHMYDEVVVMDYSFSQLQYAREYYGDEGYIYVAADAYKLPFKPGVFDGATMIRVIHHMEDVPAVLVQIRHTLCEKATFILEFANKRNLKAISRHALRKQEWNPRSLEPVEFVELNFNFHPSYIAQELGNAGFQTETSIPVSFFRVNALKQLIPAQVLAGADRAMQATRLSYSPSIFTKNIAVGDSSNNLALDRDHIFACPLTGGELVREADFMVNVEGTRWEIRDGIYDFKQPVE